MKFKTLVSEVKTGKQLPDAVYLHSSALDTLPKDLDDVVRRIAKAVKITEDRWNILKLYKRDFKLAFLNYPDFETYSYPSLERSFTVDLSKLAVRESNYGKSENPPILHRKETFVDPNHPQRTLFEEVTREGEEIGLYEKTRSIGFKKNWERLISNKGYFLDESGRLHLKADRSVTDAEAAEIDEVLRHKTAIDRNQLSQPVQILARHGYLEGDYSLLDYGCGKGDDVRELEAHGIDVSGWDPAHYPEGILAKSDIVNLGFVLNVIEDREERDDTLRRAWEYADRLLIVSVMIAGDATISQFKPYKDGIITGRKTFQKYYAQSEFRSYVETTLAVTAVAAGQGIFIVFKDEIEEQEFLLKRQHVSRHWLQKTERPQKEKSKTINKDLIDTHSELFTDFWAACLDLGRIPANAEFEFSAELRRVAGSHNKAFEALVNHFGDQVFKEAAKKRREDLLVYFALGLFEKRKPQTRMPEGLKRDIKAFFNSYNQALEEATLELFSVGDPDVVEANCIEAYEELRHGELIDGHSYIFHKGVLGELPAALRIYVGCATQLYGDLEDIQLIKAHMTSGKVSLMGYRDWDKSTPLLTERIKIKMREQDVDFFDYVGNFRPQPLLNKNAFL